VRVFSFRVFSFFSFFKSGYGWPAETSRAQAGGVAMCPLLPGRVVPSQRDHSFTWHSDQSYI
jgi:hypothetical protein